MEQGITNVNNVMDEIENGTIKYIAREESFKFSCKTCGECCHDRNDILVQPHEVFRMAKYLNITCKEFMDNCCEWFRGGQSKIPIAAIKFKEIWGGRTRCPFLKKKDDMHLCSIHLVKPYVCAIYPLGRVTITSIKNPGKDVETKYICQPVECKATIDAESHSVEQWLKDFNIEESEKLSNIYYDFIFKNNKIIDFKKLYENKFITEKTKNMYYGAFIGALYCRFDTSYDVEPQLESNYEKAIILSEMFVKTSKMIGENISK